jgi:hypothetical protein
MVDAVKSVVEDVVRLPAAAQPVGAVRADAK